jgi:uncharacterized membrane protein
MVIVDVLFRWLHVIAACLAIGGAFFIRVILPIGLGPLDAEQREGVFLRCRRAYKLVVHPCILALLVSGAYNAWKNWPKYSHDPNKAVMHGLFGTHLLLGFIVIGVSLWLLAGREPVRTHRGWMRVNLLLMFLTVAAASSLKWVRDYSVQDVSNTSSGEAPRRPGRGPVSRPSTEPADSSGANTPAGLDRGP